MKSTTTVLCSLLFSASALALDFAKLQPFAKRQHYSNSTVTEYVTPTSTLTKYLTMTVTVPTTCTSATVVPTETVYVSSYETTGASGEVSAVEYTTTQQITLTAYATVTNYIVKTISAPTSEVQNVIDSVVSQGGTVCVGNTVVSVQEKTLTVTQPIYVTVLANSTASTATPSVSTTEEVDTITVTKQITSYLPSSTAFSNSTAYFSNSTGPLVTTYTLTETSTLLTTIDHQVTSTVTNYIVVTKSVPTPTTETVTTVNEFVYNSQETVTSTPVQTITKVITLTTSLVAETSSSTIYETYYYTVTRTASNSTVTVECTATDAETYTMTQTKTVTVPVSATETVQPTFVTLSQDWNDTATVTGLSKRHIHRRRALNF